MARLARVVVPETTAFSLGWNDEPGARLNRESAEPVELENC